MKRGIFLSLILGIFLLTGIGLARVGGGDVTFKVPKAKTALFSHDFHVQTAGLTCQKCHPVPYVTREKDQRVTMAAMGQGKSCGACHNGKEAFSVSAKDKCVSCHH